MPKRHLSDSFIRNLSLPEKREIFYDQHKVDPNTHQIVKKGVKGLLLRHTKAGNKYFYYSYWFGGKSKKIKIGSYQNISLSDARREEARELAYKVNKGIDPQAEKRKRKKEEQQDQITFEDLIRLYKERHLPTLRESTQSTYKSRIDTYLYESFCDERLENIKRSEIVELLEEIALDLGYHYQSNRVRSTLSSMFSFAVQRGLMEYNPVKTIKPIGEEKARKRVYDEREIKKLWHSFNRQNEPVGSLFKILLICGQRLGETRKMKWEDISEFIWHIPAENTKAKRAHALPLTDQATEIIHGLKSKLNSNMYVFESPSKQGRPIRRVGNASKRVKEETGISDFRIHDLRRTAASYMAKLGIDRTVLGKVLNHKGLAGDSQVTAIYDRYSYMDEKRDALTKWSMRLKEIVNS